MEHSREWAKASFFPTELAIGAFNPICLATDCFPDFSQIHLNVKRIEKVEFQAIFKWLGKKNPSTKLWVRCHQQSAVVTRYGW